MVKPSKPYQGLKRDPDAIVFRDLIPHTIIQFTIEDTGYRARPHRVVFWGERKGEMVPVIPLLMTNDDLKMLYQTIKDRLGEIE